MSGGSEVGDVKQVKLANAEPGPLGVFGLACITLVASSQKLALTEGTSMIVPWAIFAGALMQLFAAVEEFKRMNVFGATAFGVFGFFWLAVATTWLIQSGVFGLEIMSMLDIKQLGLAFLAFFIISVFLTICAAGVHKCMFFIMVFIDLLLLGLALNSLGIGSFGSGMAAVAELLTGILGLYISGGTLVNDFYGKVIFPMGKPFVGKK